MEGAGQDEQRRSNFLRDCSHWLSQLCGCNIPSPTDSDVEEPDGVSTGTGEPMDFDPVRPPLLDNQPTELVLEMAKSMTPTTLLALSQTSRRYRSMLEDEFGEFLQRTRRVQAEWRRLDSQNANIQTRLQAVAADSDALDPNQQAQLVDQVMAIPKPRIRSARLGDLGPALRGFGADLQDRIVGHIENDIGQVHSPHAIARWGQNIRHFVPSVFERLVEITEERLERGQVHSLRGLIDGIPAFPAMQSRIVDMAARLSHVTNRAGAIQHLASVMAALGAGLQQRVIDIVEDLTNPANGAGMHILQLQMLQCGAIINLGGVLSLLEPAQWQRIVTLAVALGPSGTEARKALAMHGQDLLPPELLAQLG